MGLFKFVKNKGKQIVEDRNTTVANAIKKEVKDLGLDSGLGDDFKVVVDGDEVKIEGKVADQATKEKIILAAGNVDGIAQVDDKMDAKAADDEAVFYTVKSGDSLSKIAKAYLGNAMAYPDIFEANKPMLTHPDKIYPGQVLRIPGGKAKA